MIPATGFSIVRLETSKFTDLIRLQDRYAVLASHFKAVIIY